MAEGGNDGNDGSGEQSTWWNSWISSAKTKSASVYEAVKKDLGEISSAVRTEASIAGAAIEKSLKLDEPDSTVSTVKKSLSSFLDQVTEVLNPALGDDESEAVLITSDGVVTLTGFSKHLAELQINQQTYTEEPEPEFMDKFNRWLEVIEQEQFKQDVLAKHLAHSEILNEHYTTLVPNTVPHMVFWRRYLFKRALLEDALANTEIAERKSKLEMNFVSDGSVSPKKTVVPIVTNQPEKVIPDLNETGEHNEEDFKWETEDFSCNVELSEEEQARLLQEYEQELQERENRKTTSLDDELTAQLMSNVSQPVAAKSPAKVIAKVQKAGPKAKGIQPKAQTQNNTTNKNNRKTVSAETSSKSGKPSSQQHSQNPKPAINSKQQQQQQQPASGADHGDNQTKGPKKNAAAKEESSNSDESWEKEFDIEE